MRPKSTPKPDRFPPGVSESGAIQELCYAIEQHAGGVREGFEELRGRMHVLERGERIGYSPDDTDEGENFDGGVQQSGGYEKNVLGAMFAQALTEAGDGGFIVPPEFLGTVWDRLAAKSVGLRSGFTIVPTDSDELHIPRVVADAAAAWTAEGATISATDPDLDETIATPRKLAVLTAFSNELRDDSNPAVYQILASNLLRSLALKFDAGAFEGSGTPPEIRGLKNVSGIQSVSLGTNGAIPTNLDPFADAIGLLAAENAAASAIVMAPRTWQTLSKLKEQTTGNNKPLLQESAGSGSQGIERRIYGVPVYLTSQLSITETQGSSGAVASSAYVYEAAEVIAVRRQEARIQFSDARLFNSDQTEARATLRWDVVVPNVKAVARILGILA